jgi:hypothetical protein
MKKKAIGHLVKTKPIKANSPGFARKPEALNPIRLRQDYAGQEFETSAICRGFYAKQSQFLKSPDKYKLNYNKGLQKKWRFRSPKKQSQFKTNQSQF